MTARARKKLVPEPRWTSAHGQRSTAYSLGRDAGSAVTALLAQRQDHVTCSVEWYRGFCEGCGAKPEPAIETHIAREAVAVKHGLDRVAIILASLEQMTADAKEVLAADTRKGPKP